jgi:hypothetical protein
MLLTMALAYNGQQQQPQPASVVELHDPYHKTGCGWLLFVSKIYMAHGFVTDS